MKSYPFILLAVLVAVAACGGDTETPTSTTFRLQNQSGESIYTGGHLISVAEVGGEAFTWYFPCDPDLCGGCLPGEPLLEALEPGADRGTIWTGYIYGPFDGECVTRRVAPASTYEVRWCYRMEDDASVAPECISKTFTPGEDVVLLVD